MGPCRHDLPGLNPKSVDLVLGNVPQVEVVEGSVDLGSIALHGANIREVQYLRDRDPVLSTRSRISSSRLYGSEPATGRSSWIPRPRCRRPPGCRPWRHCLLVADRGIPSARSCGVVPDLAQAHHPGRSEARAAMRARRVGSSAVEPGSTSGRIVFGCNATATASFSPLRIPRAVQTSPGTLSVWA